MNAKEAAEKLGIGRKKMTRDVFNRLRTGESFHDVHKRYGLSHASMTAIWNSHNRNNPGHGGPPRTARARAFQEWEQRRQRRATTPNTAIENDVFDHDPALARSHVCICEGCKPQLYPWPAETGGPASAT